MQEARKAVKQDKIVSLATSKDRIFGEYLAVQKIRTWHFHC